MGEDDEDAREKSYLGQKREVLEVLSEYIERGNAFISDDSIADEDREEIEAGLAILRASIVGFYDFLEAGFANGKMKDPNFLNIAQYLRGAIAGASMTIKHLDAIPIEIGPPQELAAKIARDAKHVGDDMRKNKQRSVLRELTNCRPITQPYKEADAIFSTDAEQARFRLICEKHGLEPFSLSTARKRLGEMVVSKEG